MFVHFRIISNQFTTPTFLQEIQVAWHTQNWTFKSLKFELVKEKKNKKYCQSDDPWREVKRKKRKSSNNNFRPFITKILGKFSSGLQAYNSKDVCNWLAPPAQPDVLVTGRKYCGFGVYWDAQYPITEKQNNKWEGGEAKEILCLFSMCLNPVSLHVLVLWKSQDKFFLAPKENATDLVEPVLYHSITTHSFAGILGAFWSWLWQIQANSIKEWQFSTFFICTGLQTRYVALEEHQSTVSDITPARRPNKLPFPAALSLTLTHVN